MLESKVEGLTANFETGAERLDAELDDAHPDADQDTDVIGSQPRTLQIRRRHAPPLTRGALRGGESRSPRRCPRAPLLP